MTERVHRHHRRQALRVAEVVGVLALRQRWAGCRLGSDEARRCAVANVATYPRDCQTTEVGTAAEAGDNRVGLLTGHLHLQDRLLADDRLVQDHVAED